MTNSTCEQNMLLTSPGLGEGETGSFSRRRSERIPRGMAISLRLAFEGGEAWWPARIVDLSQLGLRIRTDPTLKPGRILEVVFSEEQFCSMRSRARVVWVRLRFSGLPTEAGLEFLEPLPHPVVNQLELSPV
jgi:hypothetical protein